MKLDRTECLNWCFGNLLENAVRGKVAEFIVLKALGTETENRIEWDSADLYFQGAAVEVKSSAYLQSWEQTKPSRISFDIGQRKQTWNDQTSEWVVLDPPQRVADLYVFCVFQEQDREIADPLDTDQWIFLVVATSTLNEEFGTQKTLGLEPLKQIASECKYHDLKSIVTSSLSLNDTDDSIGAMNSFVDLDQDPMTEISPEADLRQRIDTAKRVIRDKDFTESDARRFYGIPEDVEL